MRLFTASVTFGLLLAALLVVHPCEGQNWTTEAIDMGRWFDISTHAVAFDSDSHPHVVYAGNKLYYQYHDGQHWIREIVLDSDVELLQPSIILDRDLIPHIVYFKLFEGSSGSTSDRYELWHVWYQYDRWISERIAESVAFSEVPIAVSSNNYIHITFFTRDDPYQSKYTLVHAVRNLVTWITDPIQSEISNAFSSMHIDDDDVLRVLYQVYTAGYQLRLATKSNEYWQFESLPQTGTYPTYGQMFVDEGGKIHICFGMWYERDLYYMTQTDNLWVTERVSDDSRMTNVAMYMNASNKIVIGGVVSSDTTSQLTLYTKENASWNAETIDTGIDYDQTTTWTLDSQGQPRVLGIRDPSGELMLGHREGWQWVFEKLDNRGGAGTQMIAQWDRGQKIRILYSYNGVNQLRYAVNDGYNWNIQILEDGLGSTNELGLCIDSQNQSHLCYYSDNAMQLKYMREQSGAWTTEIIDDGMECSGISMALQPNQQPSILYVKDSNLILAGRSSTGEWTREIVSDQAQGCADLAIGPDGKIYLIFYKLLYEHSTDQIMYAEKLNGNWTFTQLNTTLTATYECSIELNSQGEPHVCFLIYARYGCAGYITYYDFGWQTDDGWQLENIYPKGGSIYDNVHVSARSMSFGQDDNPLVISGDHGELQVLRRYDQSWWGSKVASASTLGCVIDHPDRVDIFSTDDMILNHSVQLSLKNGVRLEMPHEYYSRDSSSCWLQAALYRSNPTGATDHLVVCLEYAGQFWFYPSWTAQFEQTDVSLTTHMTMIEIIESFYWPYNLDFHADGLVFRAALLDDSMTQIIGGDEGIDSWEFSF